MAFPGPSTSQLRGMGFYLGLNALNFAEADRPFQRLSEQQMAEMYFTMGLQCHYSIPLASSAPMVSCTTWGISMDNFYIYRSMCIYSGTISSVFAT